MSNHHHTVRHHIVVLGGGYTGTLCAIRLARRTRRKDVRITVVNPTTRFTERLRMHQIAAGQTLADHRIPDLLAGTGVDFRQGTATGLDPDRRTVELDGTDLVSYDTLVYALGSSTDTGVVPGADRHADTLDSPRRAAGFASRLAELADQSGTVVVCGGGLTGVEAAAEFAESHPGLRVTLVSVNEPGARMGERARAYLRAALDRLGVTVRVGAPVVAVWPGAVELAGGERVAFDACLWTAGVAGVPLAGEAGVAVDDRGLVVVDATLRSVSHPDIRPIGDAAAVTQAWGNLHGTCQSGMPMAAYTADAIARELRGRRVRPFRFGYIHQPVSLGRRDAVVQFTHADDTPRRGYLTGRLAVRYKGLVSSGPVPFLRFSRRMNVPVTVYQGGRATRRPAGSTPTELTAVPAPAPVPVPSDAP